MRGDVEGSGRVVTSLLFLSPSLRVHPLTFLTSFYVFPLSHLSPNHLNHISIVSKIGLQNFVRQFCAKCKKIGTLARKYAVQPQYFIIFTNEKSIFSDQSANFKIINLSFRIFKIFEFGRCLYQLTWNGIIFNLFKLCSII